MDLLKPRNLLLPLTLLSVLATGLTFTAPAFWLTSRWVLLALLSVYVLVSGRALGSISLPVLAAGFAYVLWCIATLSWSELPTLSSLKLIALVVAIFAAMWGGDHWVMTHPRAQSLDFLWPWAALSFLAGVLRGNPEQFGNQDMNLYAGSTRNPNYLGGIVAMSLPIVVWALYRSRAVTSVRLFWTGVLATLLVILYLTASRSAYLIFFGMSFGLLHAARLRRSLIVPAGVVWMTLLLVLISPGTLTSWVERNIYKGSDARIGVFDSRTRVWAESYDGAIAGGWLGLGYGVSAGSEASSFVGTFTSAGYGREKGNSQLAILEETGIVGLLLYIVLNVALFTTLWCGLSSSNGESRVALGLVIGTLLGLLAHSTLEAWWVAPGAPEFVFFWSVAGAGLGLTRIRRLSVRAGGR